MTMKVKKPGKSDIKDAVVIAFLFIVIAYTRKFVDPWLDSFTGQLGEFAGFVNAVVVGIVAATVLSIVGYGRYGALAFALALGDEIYRYVSSKFKIGA